MNKYIIELKKITKNFYIYKSPLDHLKEIINPFKKKRYYKIFNVLNNISLKIKKGDTIGVIGENGSGKSTILKIITGIVKPTFGIVKVFGKVSALLELGSGFNLEYTGYKNIFLNGMILGLSRKQILNCMNNIISFADIGKYLYQPVKTYSSGMFIRLAFAIAINVKPDILIVDEALAVGDLIFQLKCIKKFSEIKENNNTTIIFVSHDLNSIRRFCNKTFWIKNGKLIEFGKTMEITNNYENYLKKKIVINNFKKNNIKKKNIVDIYNIKLLDLKFKKKKIIKQNDTFFLKIKYFVNKNIEAPVCGIAIRTIDNYYVCGINTLLDNVKVPWKIGINVFYLKYINIPLNSGEYYFDIAFFEKNAIIPLIYKAKILNFFITNKKYIGEGLFILKHFWKETL